MRTIGVLLAVVCLGRSAVAQVSGYTSMSYGYSSNPLTNYQRIADHTIAGYLELGYENEFDASRLRLAYVGGLALFDSLSVRNYYEQRASVTYLWFGDVRGEEEQQAVTMGTDTTGTWSEVGVVASGRIDRAAYDYYDNFGMGGFLALRSTAGKQSFMRWTGEISYRNYFSVEELSHVAFLAAGNYVVRAGRGFEFGVELAGGVRHYTKKLSDTTQYTNPGNGLGQGQGTGAGGQGGGNGKNTLVNSTETNSYQFSPGITLLGKWASGSAGAHLLYRMNPGGGSRYIAQVAMLTEDLYDESFSFAGPELEMSFGQNLFLGLRLSVTAQGGTRTYDGPALALDGTEIAQVRKDLRGELEITLSRYFDIGGGFGLDFQIVGSACRNQSNDTYNDYSVEAISAGVGIGL